MIKERTAEEIGLRGISSPGKHVTIIGARGVRCVTKKIKVQVIRGGNAALSTNSPQRQHAFREKKLDLHGFRRKARLEQGG